MVVNLEQNNAPSYYIEKEKTYENFKDCPICTCCICF